jgi:hypothetical protein
MPVFFRQRNFPRFSRARLWILLVIALIGIPLGEVTDKHFPRSAASLANPAVVSDFIATPTEKPQVKNTIPTSVPAGLPSVTTLPLRGQVSVLLHRSDSALLTPAAPPAAPCLPRPPPRSC